MKLIAGLIVAFITIVVLIVVGAQSGGGGNHQRPQTQAPNVPSVSPSQPAPQTTPSEPSAFSPIMITGSGAKTTAPFALTTEEWIVDWSYTPKADPEFAVFAFFIYPRGETAGSVVSVSFAEENGTTYSYAGPGEYYIDVVAANIKNWTITIRPP